MRSERLLFITDDPHICISSEIYSSNPVNYLFFSLNRYFSELRVSCPIKEVSKSAPGFPHRLRADNIQISPRPFYFHKKELFFRPWALLKSFLCLLRDSLWADVIFYRLPSPFLVFLGVIFLIFRKKAVFYIVGDFYKRNRTSQGGMKGLLKNGIVKIYDVIERKMAACFYVLATGAELSEKYGGRIFFTSLIREAHLKKAPKRIDTDSVQLLSVGRLDANKNVKSLIYALKLLHGRGMTGIRLLIVGSGLEEKHLKNLADALKLTKYIHFAGSIPFGDSLWKQYEASDIFVLPSFSEGIPKVLYEAMASALPIIATNVGGIPWATNGGKAAVLIEPNSPEAIQAAVCKILADRTFREGLILEGLRIARQCTFEERLSCLADILSR